MPLDEDEAGLEPEVRFRRRVLDLVLVAAVIPSCPSCEERLNIVRTKLKIVVKSLFSGAMFGRPVGIGIRQKAAYTSRHERHVCSPVDKDEGYYYGNLQLMNLIANFHCRCLN